MKVYVVIRETSEECVDHGIYASLNTAIVEANALAVDAGLGLVTNYVWTNDEENMEIRIDERVVRNAL